MIWIAITIISLIISLAVCAIVNEICSVFKAKYQYKGYKSTVSKKDCSENKGK